MTNDKGFKTQEGVMVGMTLDDVLAVTKNSALTEPGWAYYVQLESGWNAAFTKGKTMTEPAQNSELGVEWLFKR